MTAEYSLRRVQAEEDRADAREATQFQRTHQQELQQRRIAPIQGQIDTLEAFSLAVAEYYLSYDELGIDAPETADAKLRFVKQAGGIYHYCDIAEKLESFRNSRPIQRQYLQELLDEVSDEVESLRRAMTRPIALLEPVAEKQVETSEPKRDSLLVSAIRKSEKRFGRWFKRIG